MGTGLERLNGKEEARDDTRLERQGCFPYTSGGFANVWSLDGSTLLARVYEL
jgi:hypothetical protein